MGSSTNLVPFNLSFSSGNVVAGFPLTVPTSATSNSIGISGAATTLPTLTWVAPTDGVLTLPSGTSAGNAYSISPYSAASLRTATVRWTVGATTQVFLPGSRTITYSLPGYTLGTAVLDNVSQQYIDQTIVLPAIYENTIATAAIGGTGEVTASVGTYSNPANFAATGSTPVSITSSNGATIPIQISCPDNWVLFNGSPASIVVDPDGIDFAGHGNYPFTIGVADNTTSSQRTAQVTISKLSTDTRTTGSAVANQTITITQNA